MSCVFSCLSDSNVLGVLIWFEMGSCWEKKQKKLVSLYYVLVRTCALGFFTV